VTGGSEVWGYASLRSAVELSCSQFRPTRKTTPALNGQFLHINFSSGCTSSSKVSRSYWPILGNRFTTRPDTHGELRVALGTNA
jgi:hypothetical protein